MTLDGNFAASVFVTGLPPLGSSAFSVATVAPTCTRLPMASLGAPDPQGRSVLTLSGVGCIAGTLTVHLTELVTPFQKFTGVLLLHS